MSLIPTRADLIEIDRKRAAELDEARFEIARLKAACPHALDGACLDWESLAARTKARAERAEAELLSARESLQIARETIEIYRSTSKQAADGFRKIAADVRALSPSPKGTQPADADCAACSGIGWVGLDEATRCPSCGGTGRAPAGTPGEGR